MISGTQPLPCPGRRDMNKAAARVSGMHACAVDAVRTDAAAGARRDDGRCRLSLVDDGDPGTHDALPLRARVRLSCQCRRLSDEYVYLIASSLGEEERGHDHRDGLRH